MPVVWDISQAQLDSMNSGGVAKYDITGQAGGMQAHAQISMIKFNFIDNYSFEDGEDPWIITDLGSTEQLYVEDKQTDSLTGSKHLHFWSAAYGSVCFTAEQKIEGLQTGKYDYSISIMGGDGGTTDIYAYIMIDGEITERVPMKITSYGNWDTACIKGIEYTKGSEFIIGIYVKCMGEGNGAWGKIDDAVLNSAD